jgi:hypothetical protein
LDIDGTNLYFEVLSQYPQFDSSSPCVMRLYPLAVVLRFLFQHNFAVDFWVQTDGLGDYRAEFYYYFVVRRKDGVREGTEKARVVVRHYS